MIRFQKKVLEIGPLFNAVISHFPFEFMMHEYERFSNRGFYLIHKLIQGT